MTIVTYEFECLCCCVVLVHSPKVVNFIIGLCSAIRLSANSLCNRFVFTFKNTNEPTERVKVFVRGYKVEIGVVRIAATDGELPAVVNNAVQTISVLSIDHNIIWNKVKHLLRLAQRGVTPMPAPTIMSTQYSEMC